MKSTEETIESELRRTHKTLYQRALKGSAFAAIRLHCLACVGISAQEVTRCTGTDCALYPFRQGTSPVKRVLTEDQREQLRQSFTLNVLSNP